MAKLIWRKKAIEDLSGIWKYTASNWSENQADKYFEMIQTASKEISSNLSVGRSYHQILPGLFGYRVGSHIIFYKKRMPDAAEIIRILHQKMDLNTRLTE